MINTTVGNAKAILDEAYDRLGLKTGSYLTHSRTSESANEMNLHCTTTSLRRICGWQKSLLEAGIEPAQDFALELRMVTFPLYGEFKG